MPGDDDNAFMRFRSNWLAYDDARPTRPRLARRFVVAVMITLLASALLVLVR